MAKEEKELENSTEAREERFEQELSCPLSDKEIVVAAQELSMLMQRSDAVEMEADQAKTAYKEQLKELEVKINEERNRVATGAEYRNVDCIRRFDFNSKQVTITRLDTGEIINQREMTERETQTEMNLAMHKREQAAADLFEEKKPDLHALMIETGRISALSIVRKLKVEEEEAILLLKKLEEEGTITTKEEDGELHYEVIQDKLENPDE